MVQIGMFPPHESGTPSMEGTEEEEGEIRVTRNDVGYRRERVRTPVLLLCGR